jgi:hypothetical protein
MRLSRLIAADCRLMPWKSGRGTAAAIAMFPAGAGLIVEIENTGEAPLARYAEVLPRVVARDA